MPIDARADYKSAPTTQSVALFCHHNSMKYFFNSPGSSIGKELRARDISDIN